MSNPIRNFLIAITLLGLGAQVHAQATDVDCIRCVDTSDIAPAAVTTGKIKRRAVTTAKIKNGAVTIKKVSSKLSNPIGMFCSVDQFLVGIDSDGILACETVVPLPQMLVLEIDFSNEIFNAGSTRDLEKGVRTYQEFGLLDAQGVPIGEYRFHAVSTLPVGSGAGWYGNESFDIFGEGVIEGISQADVSVGLFPVGSIIGGTGKFSGASGEYNSADGRTYTFTFQIPR